MEKPGSRLIFWGIVVVIIFGSIFLIIKAAAPKSDGTILTDKITAEDWIKGEANAKITIVEYSDFQCPACSYFAAIMDSITAEFGSHIQFSYRHFPLTSIHQNSMLAAQATEAAGLQGKFWEMHDILFINQKDWSNLAPYDAENQFS